MVFMTLSGLGFTVSLDDIEECWLYKNSICLTYLDIANVFLKIKFFKIILRKKHTHLKITFLGWLVELS